MTFANLNIERDGGVGMLWLDRPEKLIALHRALWDSVPAAVAHLDADPEVRVIVLAGRGKGFCAGIDLMDHAAALAGGGAISGKSERRSASDAPSTTTSAAINRAGPRTALSLAVRSTRTGTPKTGSRRSVWSLLGAGSTTDVSPLARSPARRTAVFTCADAIGER